MPGLELSFADEACAEALSDAKLLAAMARFEGALARASAACGLLAAEDAAAITEVCETARFDPAALGREARVAGALAIPFVKALTAQVASRSERAARHVHQGATSQDVADTALVLCLREASERVLALAAALGDGCAALVEAHRETPVLARTLLQPASPVPFGWKAAVWLAMLTRCTARFRQAVDEACVLQFGGAAGTLSALGARATEVEAALSEDLGLAIADCPWHSTRDSLAALGSASALLVAAAAKISRDIALAMQAEVSELAEPRTPGRGGSSSMPHKANPAGCLLALEAEKRVPALAVTLMIGAGGEHERGLGHWQSQWMTLREMLAGTGSAVGAMADVVNGLEVRADRMRENIDRTRGLAYSEAVAVALAGPLGKAKAHALAEKLCAQVASGGGTLMQALGADPEARAVLDASTQAELFRPDRASFAAARMMDRALARWNALRPTLPGRAA